jgi:nitrate reductase gamma subunit
MQTFEILIGRVLPFVTLAVLVLGLVWRLRRWNRAAVANVALYPAASNRRELIEKVLGEVAWFSSFRQDNRELWRKTWPFHVTLLVILIGHLRVMFAWPDRVLGLVMGPEAIDRLSMWAGGAVGIVAMVTCVMLLTRRFALPRVKEISSSEDVGVLILLLCILMTGNGLRFFMRYDVNVSRAYFASFFLGGEAPQNPLFLLHFFFVQLLLMYLPFGKLLHIPGVFYSKALLAKDY